MSISIPPKPFHFECTIYSSKQTKTVKISMKGGNFSFSYWSRGSEKERDDSSSGNRFRFFRFPSSWSCMCVPCDTAFDAKVAPTAMRRTPNRKTSQLHVRFTPLTSSMYSNVTHQKEFYESGHFDETSKISGVINANENIRHQSQSLEPNASMEMNESLVEKNEFGTGINFALSPNSTDEFAEVSLRRKPHALSSSVTTLEDEIYLFVIDISVKSNIDINDDRLIFDPSLYPVYFYYSGDASIYQNISTNFELVAFLRAVAFNTVGQSTSSQLRKHKRSNLTPRESFPYIYGTDKQRTVSAALSAAASLAQLLNAYQDYPKDYTDSIESLQGLWDGNCFCSIDKAIITTVSTISYHFYAFMTESRIY